MEDANMPLSEYNYRFEISFYLTMATLLLNFLSVWNFVILFLYASISTASPGFRSYLFFQLIPQSTCHELSSPDQELQQELRRIGAPSATHSDIFFLVSGNQESNESVSNSKAILQSPALFNFNYLYWLLGASRHIKAKENSFYFNIEKFTMERD